MAKIPPQAAGYVYNLPNPPLQKAGEFLKAYKGYPYTAISAIAQEVASIELKLYKKKLVRGEVETEEVLEHEALSVLQFVNRYSTFYDLLEGTQTYQELTGEAYWVILRLNGQPREIWPLRPDWVAIKPSKTNVIENYVYWPGGNRNDEITLDPKDVVPFKNFNPEEPFRGKGTIQAAAMPIDIHDFASEWNRNLFYNSAVPGLVFTNEKNIDEKVIKRFVQQWQSTYGGRKNSNKVAFLGGGFKMDKTSLNAKDMDFAEQLKMMRDDMLAVFKTPKTVLGLTDDVNRANAEATTRAFMERVITPRMRKLVNSLNEFFLPMFDGTDGLFLDFKDPRPEDNELKLKEYENGLNNGWLTPNEVRERENLEPIEGGDETLRKPFDPAAVQQTFGNNQNNNPKNEGLFERLTKWAKQEKQEEKKKAKALKKKPIKHMVSIPVKRVEEFEAEKLQGELAQDIQKLLTLELGVETKKYKPKPRPKKFPVEEMVKEAAQLFEKEIVDSNALAKEIQQQAIDEGIKEAAKITETAKDEAEKEKKNILGDLKNLRDKVRSKLSGE